MLDLKISYSFLYVCCLLIHRRQQTACALKRGFHFEAKIKHNLFIETSRRSSEGERAKDGKIIFCVLSAFHNRCLSCFSSTKDDEVYFVFILLKGQKITKACNCPTAEHAVFPPALALISCVQHV